MIRKVSSGERLALAGLKVESPRNRDSRKRGNIRLVTGVVDILASELIYIK